MSVIDVNIDNLPTTPSATARADLRFSWRKNIFEALVVKLLFACICLSAVVTLAIIAILFVESSGFFAHVSIFEFFFGTEWEPLFAPKKFGVLPIFFGTMMVAVGACIVSVPIGVGCALYMSEYSQGFFKRVAKPILELLAGIPSIVFGYFALSFVTPILRYVLPSTNVFNAASAIIVVGIMNIPTVASLSDDAFRAVPKNLKDCGYALGATKWEVITGVLLPTTASAIFAAFILAFSRAIGETMAVALAAGSTPNITMNPLESIQTMTAYIVQVSMGDTPHGSIEYQSIFVVGLSLFLITLTMNVFAQKF